MWKLNIEEANYFPNVDHRYRTNLKISQSSRLTIQSYPPPMIAPGAIQEYHPSISPI
jgi:hypothetical protein